MTSREAAEAELRRSEDRYRRLTSQSPLSIQTIAPDGTTREVNKAWENLFGVTLADIGDYNIKEDPQLQRLGVSPLLARAFAGEAVDIPPIAYAPDRGRYAGRKLWVRAIAYPVTGDSGEVLEVVLIHQDITDQKHAEEALHRSEERLRLALSAARLGDWSWDAATDVVTLSERAAEIFGIPPGPHMTWTAMQNLIDPDDREAARLAVEQAVAERSDYSVQYRVLRPSGEYVWVAASGRPIYADGGAPVGMLGLVRDVTARKAAEERQRLLVNELNHRVKNTLAVVQAIATQTLRSSSDVEHAREALESRLLALSRTHDVLTLEGWDGGSLRRIVSEATAPYLTGRADRLQVSGPDVRLQPRSAVPVALVLQELLTNAVKHGSLASGAGRVSLDWHLSEALSPPRLVIEWKESSGPPVVEPVSRRFGTRLIERSVREQLRGTVRMDFQASGLVCTIDVPLG